MRQHLSTVLLLLVPFTTKAQTETEPNQGLPDATVNPAWAPGATYSGSIAMDPPPLDYYDFFRIELLEDATVTMDVVASSPAAANVVVTIYDVNGTAISHLGNGFGAASSPVSSSLVFDCLQAGTYFFQLTPDQGSNITYAITWTYQGALFGNDAEPNADGVQALANGLLQDGVWREGHHSFNISDALTDHVDVHMLEIPEDGAVQVTVIASYLSGPGASLDVRLVDTTGTVMTSMYAEVGANGDTDTTSMEFLCLKDGRYAVVIYGINTCGVSYRLRYDHSPAPWADDQDMTTVLPPGLWVEGHMSFNGNGGEPTSDWFSVEVPEHHVLRLELLAADMNGGSATTDLRVYDSLSTNVASWYGESGPNNDPDTNVHVIGCLPAGTYGVWLTHINGCGVSYRLRAFVDPPAYGDDPEPNNSIATSLLAVPDTANHGFLRDSDVDVWRFYKQYSGPLQMDLRASTQTPTPGTIHFTILDMNGTVLDQTSMVTGTDNATNPYTPHTFNVTAQDTLILQASYLNATCMSYAFRFAGGIIGIDDAEGAHQDLRVRPVPGADGHYLLTAPRAVAEVLVFDMQGALVRTIRGNGTVVAIDLTGATPGVHACLVFDADGRANLVRLMHAR
ncbi:MAG: PPC domain-containing protein [Flavobacteriales bacterium]|nr:hypothetical protein [Flavobacteriales bacterium]MCC6577691.1 PPC domain-containing protein [Flavobacteriales bacterium]NUQ15072.1 PPC domain-containing protein [Flavobacteriales bacterium]